MPGRACPLALATALHFTDSLQNLRKYLPGTIVF
jgi:hypothetical protein